jgi:SAM-dependent methyltransferase
MQMGCSINLHGEGLLQAIWTERQKPITEQEKYKKLWSMPEYRITSPGESVVDEFIAQSGVSRDDIVIDIGCGTGRAALAISEKVGCKVKLIDFADNCLDDNARGLDIAMLDISQQHIGLRGTIGFCCDVLEHIPTDLLDFTVKNILKSVKKCFFQISTVDDVCGALIGHPLHLSVYDAEWWCGFFESTGAKIESKTVKQDCVLLIINNEGN